MSGPGVGITGNYPLGRAAILYGNLTLSLMSLDYYELKIEGKKSTTRDMTGVSIELGVAGALSKNLSVNGGVKNQEFSGEGEEGENEEKFLGLTAGISYMFGL
ncbi:hypothetical protein KJ693_12200 [bacterium]|nr:hypothetical protein [bacterium]